jgi:REP element-mobilizing transposase RayT
MGHSYLNILVHVVFSTKERRKLIAVEKQEELWRYLTGIGKNLGFSVLAVGGISDHAHLLMVLPGTMQLSVAVQKLKTNSSKWMSQHVREFSWQEGFGAFTVSASDRDQVIRYIHNQAEHHKKRTFEEEFVALLKAVGVDYDPKYVFG